MFLGVRKLLLQLLNPLALSGNLTGFRLAGHRLFGRRPNILEYYHQQAPRTFRFAERLDGEIDGLVITVGLDLQTLRGYAFFLCNCAANGACQFDP